MPVIEDYNPVTRKGWRRSKKGNLTRFLPDYYARVTVYRRGDWWAWVISYPQEDRSSFSEETFETEGEAVVAVESRITAWEDPIDEQEREL